MALTSLRLRLLYSGFGRWRGREEGLTMVEDFSVTGRALSCETLLSLPEKETEA